MPNLAVIDTETNWSDKVMSIGAVIADDITYEPIIFKYYIITPEHLSGGMYSHNLYFDDVKLDLECFRNEAITDLINCLHDNSISNIFAYNASFDYRHLPELSNFSWYDIIKIAAYKQHNLKIPSSAECYATGRMKHSYGVENMYRLLCNDDMYNEKHNALTDAFDELKIMELLNCKAGVYCQL